MNEPAYVPVNRFAELLSTDEMTVRRLIAAGKLAAIDITPNAKKRKLRVPITELARLQKTLAVSR